MPAFTIDCGIARPLSLNTASSDTSSWVLYQSSRLSAYGNRLIHGFTGKPLTLGNKAYPREEILANRRQLCELTGMNAEALLVPDQVHSTTIRLQRETDLSSCDGIIIDEPGTPAMVLAADCVPIILYDPQAHVGAVIHAGWRGTAAGIVREGIRQMVREHGCRAEDIIGVIGPSVAGCCYEVSPEVAEALLSQVSASQGQTDRIPTVDIPLIHWLPNGNPKVDLKRFNAKQMEQEGLQAIEVMDLCTLCHPDQFWSYRRGENGRQGAFIQLL